MGSIANLEQYLYKKQGEKAHLNKQLKQRKENAIREKKQLRTAEEAQEIIKLAASETQKQLQYHISNITTLALESVFGADAYELVVDFVERRNKTECDILFQREGKTVDPLNASGGGAVDIAAFALRVATWSMQNPKTRKVMILDEPFKNLSREYQEKGSEMLKELSTRLGIQFIIVTHEERITKEADKVFSLTQVNGISKLE